MSKCLTIPMNNKFYNPHFDNWVMVKWYKDDKKPITKIKLNHKTLKQTYIKVERYNS